jgi:hypothetical protein
LPAAITTTLIDMPSFPVPTLRRWWTALIIGVAAVLLAGCSSLRLAYGGGPQLAWWWLDGYFDFTVEQSDAARGAIDGWFDWHRRTQLVPTAVFLESVASEMSEPTTPQAVCRVQERAAALVDVAVQQAILAAAPVSARLGPPQLRHLELRHEKVNAELRDEYLKPSPEQRRRATVERLVDRTENLYGRLDEAQRRLIAEGIETSPFEPERWLAERERRQRETLGTLRRLQAERADADQRIAALRALASHFGQSPDPAYRSYRDRLATYNCAFGARIHNATTPAQRQAARERLRGWASDLRAIAASATAP